MNTKDRYGELFFTLDKERLQKNPFLVMAPVDCSVLLEYSGIENIFSLGGFHSPAEFKLAVEDILGFRLDDWNAVRETIYQCWQPSFREQHPIEHKRSLSLIQKEAYDNDLCRVTWAGSNIESNIPKLKVFSFSAMILRHKSFSAFSDTMSEPWLISRQRSYASVIAQTYHPLMPIEPSIMGLVSEVGIRLKGEKNGVAYENLIWPTGNAITLLSAAKELSMNGFSNIKITGDDLCLDYHSLSEYEKKSLINATKNYGTNLYFSDLLVNAGFL